jgi:hypothetical protein
MNRDNMFMNHRRRGLRLASEPSPRRAAGRQFGSEHLDGHEPIQGGVEPLEHDPHPTTSDHAANLIRPDGSEGRQTIEGVWIGLVLDFLKWAEERAGLLPPGFSSGERIQPATAEIAGFEVAGKVVVIALVESVVQEST